MIYFGLGVSTLAASTVICIIFGNAEFKKKEIPWEQNIVMKNIESSTMCCFSK
jgi:hypothetical protein